MEQRLARGRTTIRQVWLVRSFYGLLVLPILFSNRFRPGDEDAGPIWTDAIRQKVFLEMPIWALMGYALRLGISRIKGKKRGNTV